MVRRDAHGRFLAAGSVLILIVVVGVIAVGRISDRAGGDPGAGAPIGPVVPVDPKALRSLGNQRALRIGTAVDAGALAKDPPYAAIIGSQFSSVTPENAMKWSYVEPHPGVFTWDGADRVVAFAEQHGQGVYGHTLVWDQGLPDWLLTNTFTPQQLRDLLHQHITTEVSRYRGRVWAWDVVNEALGPDGKPRDTLWLRALGPNYIADAFRWAHEADPDAKLFLNDYRAEATNAKSDGLYSLVRTLKADKVPITGVGFQTHWGLEPVPSTFAANLKRFTALGVDVAVTEADVRLGLPATAAKLTAQAKIYQQVLGVCLSVRRCVSFTVWGFSDRYSWIPEVQPGAGAACLMDARLQAKPAWTAIATTLAAKNTR